LFRAISPSVVLIVTEDGLGSGSEIAAGKILTSLHVVAGAKEIGVVFKPAEEGRQLVNSDVIRAHVVAADEVSDLAIVEYPSNIKSVKPIDLGSSSEIEVVADVNAIGHPTGEAWTFTRGVISQVRKGYEWKAEDGIVHRADVVQTQTPINPGNSGGPLLADNGHLIGVNAFKTDGEGLNFAVSVATVRQFIASPLKPKSMKRKQECVPKVLYEGRNRDNDASIRLSDAFCTGKGNVLYVVPDDQRRSIKLLIDSSGSGKPDIWVYDWDRDGKWDYSLQSSKKDGKIDLIGYHPNGDVMPSRVEPYRGQPTPWAN
jgi:S1-C subfamily serine protease